MWRNPMYPQPETSDADRPAPPAETGERLVTCARPGSRGTRDAELRVTRDEYQGHEYLSVRLWEKDPSTGAWWPTKKGCSIRLSEARDVGEALLAIAERVEPLADSCPSAGEPRRPPGRQGRPSRDARLSVGEHGLPPSRYSSAHMDDL